MMVHERLLLMKVAVLLNVSMRFNCLNLMRLVLLQTNQLLRMVSWLWSHYIVHCISKANSMMN